MLLLKPWHILKSLSSFINTVYFRMFSFLDIPSFSVSLRTWLSLMHNSFASWECWNPSEVVIFIFTYLRQISPYLVMPQSAAIGHNECTLHNPVSYCAGILPERFCVKLLIMVYSFLVAVTHLWVHASLHEYVCGNVPIMDMFRTCLALLLLGISVFPYMVMLFCGSTAATLHSTMQQAEGEFCLWEVELASLYSNCSCHWCM